MLSAILMEFAEGHESVAHGSDMNGVLIAALACLRYVTKVYDRATKLSACYIVDRSERGGRRH